jgi:hypothetical protein
MGRFYILTSRSARGVSYMFAVKRAVRPGKRARRRGDSRSRRRRADGQRQASKCRRCAMARRTSPGSVVKRVTVNIAASPTFA